MTPLLVIRPQPGCAATLAAADELGLEAQGFPLFVVGPVAWKMSDQPVDALLVGSANAFRHGGVLLTALHDKPAYVVGPMTAAAAEAAGFSVAATGSGGLQNVLGAIQPGTTTLLRLCGDDRVALAPPAGVTIVERVVYRSDPVPMPDALVRQLASPAVVLLHSAESARHFATQCDARAIDRRHIALAAIGPRVAEAADGGWGLVAAAEQPDDTALLALARNLCQTFGR